MLQQIETIERFLTAATRVPRTIRMEDMEALLSAARALIAQAILEPLTDRQTKMVHHLTVRILRTGAAYALGAANDLPGAESRWVVHARGALRLARVAREIWQAPGVSMLGR